MCCTVPSSETISSKIHSYVVSIHSCPVSDDWSLCFCVQVLEQFDLAEAKVKEALAVKPNWFDSYLQLGGKTAWRLY